MKITFVLPSYPWRPIGAFRVVYEYANQLVTRGHEVTVAHARRLKDEEEFWAPRGAYQRLRVAARWARNVALKPSMSWCRLDVRVRTLFVPEPAARFIPDADAIIAGAWGTAPYVLRLPESKGEKFHLIQSYAANFGLPETWVNTIWKAPLHNIFIARWQVEIARRLGVSDFTLIPNGIDQSLFRVVDPIEGRTRRIAMLFSTNHVKGSRDGIEALQIARRAHPDLQAVFFGVPPKLPEVPAWVEYHRDPPQEDLARNVYNSSSIFLCPSLAEGFPLPPAEAMACGCALVSTTCTGISEYAEQEATALLSPPGDPKALADNIARLLKDDDLRVRIAKAGHRGIQPFTWERSTDLLQQFIAACLGRAQPARHTKQGRAAP